MPRLLAFLLPCAILAAEPRPVPEFKTAIERFDPAFDALIVPDTQVEKIAEGFTWSEGPVWFKGGLVFSDVPENTAYRWEPGAAKAVVFLKPSGTVTPKEGFREPGSNGLSVDAAGNLILCQCGERRIGRLNADGSQTSLADRFEGKRLNTPNDLAIRRNGDIYFTDPTYGFEKGNDSPLRELNFNGVFRAAKDGSVTAVIKDLTYPNGIAFSPDEKILYIGVSDADMLIWAYDVQPDGSVTNKRVFFDAKPLNRPGLKGGPDGMKVDLQGNVFTTGPGGVLVISPRGKCLGRILTGQQTGNCCFGGADGSDLYICANMFICRVKTKTKGAGF